MSIKKTKTIKTPIFVKSKTISPNGANSQVKHNAKSSLQKIRTTVNMDQVMHRKTKQFASKNNLSINDLINTAIKQYINK